MGRMAFGPDIAQGQKALRAPACQQPSTMAHSTLRCDVPGLTARMPAITEGTVASVAARSFANSDSLGTSSSA